MPKLSKRTKNSLKKTVKVYSKSLTDQQFQQLDNLTVEYGICRSMFFNQLCGIRNMLNINHFRKLRNQIRQLGLGTIYQNRYHFLGKHWIYALMDTCGNVKSMWSNLANRIRNTIRDNDNINKDEQHYLFFILKFPELWHSILVYDQNSVQRIDKKYRVKYLSLQNRLTNDQLRHAHSYLRRVTRRYKPKPRASKRQNRSMTYDENMYRFETSRHFRFSSNEPRKVIDVVLTTDWHYRKNGNIQIILDRIKKRIEIHKLISTHTQLLPQAKPLGIDKGLATLISCSSNDEYGLNFSYLLNTEVERLCKINAARNYQRNKGYSTGFKRYNHRKQRSQEQLHKFVNHTILSMLKTELPVVIVKEDLSFTKDKLSKKRDKRKAKMHRKLNSWVKGYLNNRIEYLCQKYNIPFVDVNPAYTSQYCPHCHQHFTDRYGKHNEFVICPNCGKLNANTSAAKNILQRKDDSEITLYTPYKKVKKILDQRALQNN